MATGFNPKHTKSYFLADLTAPEFIALAIEAVKVLKWEVFYVSNNGFKADTGSSFSSSRHEVKVRISDGMATLESISLTGEMIDTGKNKWNLDHLISTIESIKPTWSTEELQAKFEAMDLVPEDQDDLLIPSPMATGKIKKLFSVFVPSEGYFVTPILVNLNLLIFALMVLCGVSVFSPDMESLIKWGANFKPRTLNGEPWRLITNCFLHIGIIHLLLNMYALIYIGILLEPYLGKVRFLFAYLLTGICASMFSLWWHDLTVSAGASGAIFGMYGVFLAMLTTDLIHQEVRKNLLASMVVFVAYNLLNGLRGGIDNAAHIGGLLGGLAIGYALVPGLKQPDKPALTTNMITLLTVLVLSISFLVYIQLPNNFKLIEEKMKVFVTNESMALEVFHLPDTTATTDLLYEIKDRGIYYWNENVKILNELEKLSIPQQVHERNMVLLNYCELRLKSFQLLYNAANTGDLHKNDAQVSAYNRQIEALLKGLRRE